MNASFWTFAPMGQYLAAIPYTQDGRYTGPYLWSNAGSSSEFLRPSGSPGCRVGATVGQFLMLGDYLQSFTQLVFTGDGSTTAYSGSITAPMLATGSIFDSAGSLAGGFMNGNITGSGLLASGTIDYSTGALSLTFGTAPANGDLVYAQYTQAAPYRVWWSAIGDPTNWPVPLTNNAVAFQSGYQDNQVDLGPVMFIAGYPEYALIFQTYGITRANYIGGAPVFQFLPYEFTRGVVAHGAAIQVGNYVFYLSDEGFIYTDGANVLPFGTLPDNSAGIDNWFWANVNQNALEAIRAGYDATKRCIFFAVPTGTNTLPDTLLTFNVLAQKWTKASVPVQTIWTADNGGANPGTRQNLGLINQNNVPGTLTGAPMTGYLESCDVYFVDGMRRLTSAVRPHVNSTDLPLITIGNRDSLQDQVTYSTSEYPDSFSREAPVLGEGAYTRLRTQSTHATSIHGGTLMIETEART